MLCLIYIRSLLKTNYEAAIPAGCLL